MEVACVSETLIPVTHYTVSQSRQPECERIHQLEYDILVYPMEQERPQTDRQTDNRGDALSVPMLARLSASLTSRSVKLLRRVRVEVPTATEK
jgi:hypothetical protein